MAKSKNVKTPTLDTLRTALRTPPDPGAVRGAISRKLDLLMTDIVELKQKGATYAEVASRLAAAGFIVSQHTIAARVKAKIRAEKLAEVTPSGSGKNTEFSALPGKITPKPIRTLTGNLSLPRVDTQEVNPFEPEIRS